MILRCRARPRYVGGSAPPMHDVASTLFSFQDEPETPIEAKPSENTTRASRQSQKASRKSALKLDDKEPGVKTAGKSTTEKSLKY